MISTRLHGVIDYGVSALLAGLSGCRSLAPPIRGALGSAGAFHASYAVLTDYEAGFRSRLTMRQHLALDAFGAAALCATGLLLRRQSAAGRALLIAVGLSELAVVALSSSQPASGPGQGSGPLERLLGAKESGSDRVGYPPLDTPKPVADDIFIVDSVLPGIMGKVLPVRMAVIRLPDGGLLLHSPTRFSHALRRELEQIGEIRHLVAPNIAHWTFLEEWQRHFPQATTWAAPGLRERSQVRKSHVRLDHDLADIVPPQWGDGFDLVTVPGGMGFRETALFHRPTRTLLLTDLVLNLEADHLPAGARPLVRWFGSMAPDAMPPPYLRAVVKLKRDLAAEAAERLLQLRPERVIFAHGAWFRQNGTEALRRSLRWLLD